LDRCAAPVVKANLVQNMAVPRAFKTDESFLEKIAIIECDIVISSLVLARDSIR
jgi:hypothetical protein